MDKQMWLDLNIAITYARDYAGDPEVIEAADRANDWLMAQDWTE